MSARQTALKHRYTQNVLVFVKLWDSCRPSNEQFVGGKFFSNFFTATLSELFLCDVFINKKNYVLLDKLFLDGKLYLCCAFSVHFLTFGMKT